MVTARSIYKSRKFHYGMDFTAPRGTFINGDGKVTRADNTATGYGNHVVIDHGYGYESLYALTIQCGRTK